jgi:hypothetical protein
MTRLESIRNNAFLLGLNMTRATKEQKIQWLCQIIDNETDKPEDEMDFALIGECSAYLRELSDKAAEATKEQKRRILQQIKAHHNQTATNITKVFRPSWRKVGRIVAIAAAVAALLLSSLTVLAKVNGYSSAWEYVRENAKIFFNMSSGSKVEDGEITLTKHDGVVNYSSIEELLKEEGYDILYPSNLPEGVRISQILQQIVSEDYVVYCYQFTDESVSMTVSSVARISSESLSRYECHETENITFYLKKRSDTLYEAVTYDGPYEYQIHCKDYDTLIMIINGMKGIEQ